MRLIVLLLLLLLNACATAGEAPAAFEQGQVWRLRDPQFGNARVVIGSVEQRGGRRVVHASIFGLPGPQSDAVLFAALRREGNDANRDGQPMHFIASGFMSPHGNWSPMTVDFTISRDSPRTLLSVPHIAVYEFELRRAVSQLEQTGPTLHSMFAVEMQIWRDTELHSPTLNNEDLEHPLSKRIAATIREATSIASDADIASHMGPPPPALAGPDESVVEDASLDVRCREIVAPPPLSARVVADLLRHGYTRDEIPEIDVTLSNITVTNSTEWGHIWRADTHDNRSSAEQGWARSVCWRKNADEQPSVTSYPRPAENH